MFQHFNLSRNKRLRTLEITAEAIKAAGGTASVDFLETILSTVTPLAPLDFVIVYLDADLGGLQLCPWCDHRDTVCTRHWPLLMAKRARRHQQLLGMFREVHSAHDFRLVLCADVSDCMLEYAARILGGFVKAIGFSREPLIIYERRTIRTRDADNATGWSTKWDIPSSAL